MGTRMDARLLIQAVRKEKEENAKQELQTKSARDIFTEKVVKAERRRKEELSAKEGEDLDEERRQQLREREEDRAKQISNDQEGSRELAAEKSAKMKMQADAEKSGTELRR